MSNIHRNIVAYRTRLTMRVNRGLIAIGRRIFDESQVLVPYDTTALMNSGGMRIEAGTGGFVKVIVGYGGQDEVYSGIYSPKEGKYLIRRPAEYAVIVHEDHTQFHGEQGRTAGFLRAPARNEEGNIAVFNRVVINFN